MKHRYKINGKKILGEEMAKYKKINKCIKSIILIKLNFYPPL